MTDLLTVDVVMVAFWIFDRSMVLDTAAASVRLLELAKEASKDVLLTMPWDSVVFEIVLLNTTDPLIPDRAAVLFEMVEFAIVLNETFP